MSHATRIARGLALALFASACVSVGPDYEAPEIELPAEHAADLAGLDAELFPNADAVDLVEWWSAFDDPILTDLIVRAAQSSFDLRAAVARVDEARAALGVERAARGPRFEATADYTRSGISKNTQFGLFPGQARESDDYTAGVTASWEIDLWGRTRRMVEASRAELEARIEDHAAVQVSLVGQVADAYLRLRELQRREHFARENVTVLEESLGTARARYDAGLTRDLDVMRASAELESGRALLPDVRRAREAVETELELLLGLRPGELALSLAPNADGATPIPRATGRVGEQVPADLLRRRPDLRAAERRLAAQTARVGIATAELYPRLTLAGGVGLQSERADDLFSNGSGTNFYGPSLSMPLFSSGALRARIRVEDARVETALVEYERSVVTALHEVDDAASAIRRERERAAALERAREQARLGLERAATLYREGLASLDTVLDARRSLYAIEDNFARASAAASRAHVSLYRVLGGGWPGAGTREADGVVAN